MTVGDLLDIAEAVFSGQLMTTIVLCTGTRLDGIPRSIPVIQAVLLGAGLVAYRGVLNVREGRRRKIDQPRHASKNVIFIGLNEWSALVVKFLKTQVPERWRVIALLDQEARWIGRSVHGVQVLGQPNELEAVIEEFEMHGVRTDRVVMGSETEELSQRALTDILLASAALGNRGRHRRSRRRFAGIILAAAHWTERPGTADLQATNTAAPFQSKRTEDTRAPAPFVDWASA